MNNDIESELQRKPMRPLPGEWRSQILNAATRAATEDSIRSARSAFHWWEGAFWPSPRAWGAVAAVWIVIIGLNVMNSDPGSSAERSVIHAGGIPIRALKERAELAASLTQDGIVANEPQPLP